MKRIIIYSLIIISFGLTFCKKTENSKNNFITAKFNSEEISFSGFSGVTIHYDEQAYANVYHLRGVSEKGKFPIKQLSIRIKEWQEGSNSNNPDGGVYKLWVTYSVGEDYYYVEHNVGEFEVVLNKKPNTNIFDHGSFEGELVGAKGTISVTQGSFKFAVD